MLSRYLSNNAEEASSSQNGLVQDLAGPQDPLWNTLHERWTKKTLLAIKTVSEMMLTCLARFLREAVQTVLLRVIYKSRKNQSNSFHGCLRVSANCVEQFTDTSELLTNAWDWLTSWPSVMTRKKNPWVWTRYKAGIEYSDYTALLQYKRMIRLSADDELNANYVLAGL